MFTQQLDFRARDCACSVQLATAITVQVQIARRRDNVDRRVTGEMGTFPISPLHRHLKRALAGFDYQAVHLLCELRGEQWSNTNQEKNRGHSLWFTALQAN